MAAIMSVRVVISPCNILCNRIDTAAVFQVSHSVRENPKFNSSEKIPYPTLLGDPDPLVNTWMTFSL